MKLDAIDISILASVLGVGFIAFMVIFYKFGWLNCYGTTAKDGTRKPVPVNATTRDFFPELEKQAF
ncbi:hypothetical protein ABW20_dc0103066 [Dactylellina cionopaga]|nr:hypothetical protein ABW20_dc0103066 [Dactylellina cionopaga]